MRERVKTFFLGRTCFTIIPLKSIEPIRGKVIAFLVNDSG